MVKEAYVCGDVATERTADEFSHQFPVCRRLEIKHGELEGGCSPLRRARAGISRGIGGDRLKPGRTLKVVAEHEWPDRTEKHLGNGDVQRSPTAARTSIGRKFEEELPKRAGAIIRVPGLLAVILINAEIDDAWRHVPRNRRGGEAGVKVDHTQRSGATARLGVKATAIAGVLVVQPLFLPDERGFYFSPFRADDFAELGLPTLFAQLSTHGRTGT